MIIGDIADGLARGVETTVNTVSEAFFEPAIRLGVTGLSRAGKTVFITSLVANLMDRARMPALRAAADGRIEAVWLQPQPAGYSPRGGREHTDKAADRGFAAAAADSPHLHG